MILFKVRYSVIRDPREVKESTLPYFETGYHHRSIESAKNEIRETWTNTVNYLTSQGFDASQIEETRQYFGKHTEIVGIDDHYWNGLI